MACLWKSRTRPAWSGAWIGFITTPSPWQRNRWREGIVLQVDGVRCTRSRFTPSATRLLLFARRHPPSGSYGPPHSAGGRSREREGEGMDGGRRKCSPQIDRATQYSASNGMNRQASSAVSSCSSVIGRRGWGEANWWASQKTEDITVREDDHASYTHFNDCLLVNNVKKVLDNGLCLTFDYALP